MKKLFIFHGDLGAGKNVLKNIVLLSPEVHFPIEDLPSSREDWLVKNIYKPESKSNWFKYEYMLKDYPTYDINMPLGDADVDNLLTPSVKMLSLLEKENYALDLFNKSRVSEIINLPFVKFVSVYPKTSKGLRWQIRAYAEKKIPELVHNFTYTDHSLIEKHKAEFGIESWTKVNLFNFYKDAEHYVSQLREKNWPTIPLEWLLDSARWPDIIVQLQDIFNINIPVQSAYNVLAAWTKLHWEFNDTDNWEHIDIFDGFRSTKSDQMIRMDSCK